LGVGSFLDPSYLGNSKSYNKSVDTFPIGISIPKIAYK
jgi:hypothetical protein